MGKRVNWEQIKAEYITQKTSYRALSKKYGVSFSAIAQKARQERWIELRKNNCENIVKNVVQKSAFLEAKKLQKELMIADQISDVLEAALRDAKQFHRHVIKYGTDDGVLGQKEEIFEKIDMNALKAAAETLKLVEGMKRSMLSILTEPERMRFELEKKRLELQERLANQGQREESAESGVILIPKRETKQGETVVYEDMTEECSAEEQGTAGAGVGRDEKERR